MNIEYLRSVNPLQDSCESHLLHERVGARLLTIAEKVLGVATLVSLISPLSKTSSAREDASSRTRRARGDGNRNERGFRA